MIHEELYLNLNYNQKVIFAIAIVMIVLIISIITRIKNKAKIIKRRQVNRMKTKNNFKIDYNEFIKVNFKKQNFLYENRNRKAELIRMFN